MKKLSFLIPFLVSTNLLASDPLIIKAINEMEGVSARVIMMAGEELKHKYAPDVLSEKLDMTVNGGELFQTTEEDFKSYIDRQHLNTFETSYRKFQTDYRILENENLVRNTGSLVVLGGLAAATAAASAATAATGGLAAPLAIAVGSTLVAEVSSRGFDVLNDKAQEDASALVTDFIKNVIGKEKEYLLRDLDAETLQKINEEYRLQEKLEKHVFCESCNADERRIMTGAALQNLSNLMKGQAGAIERLKKNLDITQDQLEVHRTAITTLATTVAQYQRQTNDSIERLGRAQEEINERLDDLQTKVEANIQQTKENTEAIAKNTDDINFLKDFMYKRMTPAERLAAIQKGIVKGNFTEEKMTLLKLQVSFQKHAGDLMNGMNQFNNIAQNLGIKVPKDLQKAIEFGNRAYSAVNGVLNGLQSGGPLGYLGAVSAVTGFFSKSRDVGAERHAQIMKALGVINKKLDIVMQNQEAILKNQVMILTKLDQIEKRIIETSQVLYEAIELTRQDIRYNRMALNQIINRPLSNCHNFSRDMQRILRMNLTSKSVWKKRQAFFNNTLNKNTFNECTRIRDDLSLLRKNRKASVNFLLGLNEESDVVSNAGYIEKYYKVIARFQDKIRNDSSIPYLTALNTHLDVREYLKFHEALKLQPNAKEEIFDREHWLDDNNRNIDIPLLMQEPLYFESLINMSVTVNDVHHYFDIVDDNRLPPLEDIMDQMGLGIASPGHSILSDVKLHLQTALLQMGMLSGMSFIPSLYDRLENKDLVNDINQILKLSPTIKKNFLSYLIFNKTQKYSSVFKLKNSGLSSAYDMALMMKNQGYLSNILESSEKTIYQVQCGEKCELVIGTEKYDLPTSIELGDGVVSHHPMLSTVLDMISLTNQNLLSYRIHDQMAMEDIMDAKAFRLLLLKSATAQPKI